MRIGIDIDGVLTNIEEFTLNHFLSFVWSIMLNIQ